MNKNQMRLMAVGLWLVTLACGIAFAAMRGEYTSLRDGTRHHGTVTSVDAYRRQLGITITYGGTETYRAYVPIAQAKQFMVGTTVDLLEGGPRFIRASQLDDYRPSPLIAVGGVLALVLGVYVWLAPRRAAKRRAARREAIEVIIEGVARTRNITIALGVFLVAAGAFFCALPALDTSAGRGGSIFIVGLGVLSVGFAVVMFVRAYRLRDPSRNPVVELIERRPADIAWFYVRSFRSRGTETLDAMIWKTDGKATNIRLVPEDVDALMGELARRAPHAVQGYDAEIEKRYRANPTQWRPAS